MALRALGLIVVRGRKPKEVIEDLTEGMDHRDRAFVMEVVYGVLRHPDYLDYLLQHFLKRFSGVTLATLNNLRIGLYQAEFMRVPEWALVNEAAEMEKSRRGKVALVNGVLRNFLRQRPTIAMPPENDPLRHISVTQSHPRWLVRRWIERFGPAGALSLARANNEVPPLTLRISAEADRESILALLAAKDIEASAGRYSPTAVVFKDRCPLEELTGLLPYGSIVQDEASQLVGYLVDPQPGERVLDACAAPGGKTTHLAQLMGDRGEVVAVERDTSRIPRLRDNIGRLGISSVRIVAGDAGSLEAADHFDRILLDAPCSALGVIRRNPDVRYRHAEKDLARFGRSQLALLKSLCSRLRPGGSMVYSVCSTEPEEGEDVVREFVRCHPGFSVTEGTRDFLRPFLADAGTPPFYRTFPHLHGTDGFFAARLIRGK
jgi:16S rRNA (cytosine967-C5)-methyltransferase